MHLTRTFVEGAKWTDVETIDISKINVRGCKGLLLMLECNAGEMRYKRRFWIGSIIFGWGLLIIVHSIYVCTRLLDASTFVSEEYYRLKQLALSKK